MTNRNSSSSGVQVNDARHAVNAENSSILSDRSATRLVPRLSAAVLGVLLLPGLGATEPRRVDGPIEPPYVPDLPALNVSDSQMAEGDEGATVLRFKLRLSPESAVPVMVWYRVVDRTARSADGDYQATRGTVTIPAHTTASEIPITVFGDRASEAHETFQLILDSATNALIGDGVAIGRIANDDFGGAGGDGDGVGRDPRIPLDPEGQPMVLPGPDDPPPVHGLVVSLTVLDNATREGADGPSALQFRIDVSPESSLPITLSYQLVDRTASCADRDYQAATGTVTIPAHRSSSVIAATIFGDNVRESDETFQLTLTDVNHAQMVGGVATGTIANDDFESGGGEGGGHRRRPGSPLGGIAGAPGDQSVAPSFGLACVNPVVGRPSFKFALARSTHVSLAIYDLAGRMVGTPMEGFYSAGTHVQAWGQSRPGPGIYLARFRAAGQTVTRRITWLD